MALDTQGTNLYFIDLDGATDPAVIAVGCPTGISGFSSPRDQREVTCLEDLARQYEAGMITPGALTITLNFDPADTSHIRMHELYNAGTTLSFAIGLSDGTAAPTLDTDNDFEFPTSRSFLQFDGYISDFPFDFALASNVSSSVAVQMSGLPVLIPKA